MATDRKSRLLAYFLAFVVSITGFSVRAATSIESINTEFTPENAAQTLTAKAQSWYNPTMGYTGWTHHSSWGYMKLKRGKPVTITLQGVSGFHPGITVWYRPQAKRLVPLQYANSHSYSQFNDIIANNVDLTDDPSNPVSLGDLRMEYVANAFDRDGMSDPLPAAYDHSMLTRVLDGTSGTVALSFTPKESGYYQFVVGGINPDSALSKTDRHNVTVTVSFPE